MFTNSTVNFGWLGQLKRCSPFFGCSKSRLNHATVAEFSESLRPGRLRCALAHCLITLRSAVFAFAACLLATTAPLWIGDCKFLTINDCLRAPIGSDPRPRLRFLHPSLLQCASLSGLHQNGQPLTRFPFYTFSSPRMVQKSSARLSSEM